MSINAEMDDPYWTIAKLLYGYGVSGCLYIGMFAGFVSIILISLSKIFGDLLSRFNPKWKGKILLVIAHPDDECMFFGPSLNHVLRIVDTKNVYLLCLTNGNYYGLGKLREKELFMSCASFGMKKENVEIVDDVSFQDGEDEWDNKRVMEAIIKFTIKHEISSILTFDGKGVSNHRNHKAIYDAICHHHVSDSKAKGRIVECHFLESINILRKYISFFDLFYSILDCCISNRLKKKSKSIILGSWNDIVVTQNSMKEHKSQFVWFRKLFILFSRYIVINTLDFQIVSI